MIIKTKKAENVHRFAFSAITWEILEREREKEREREGERERERKYYFRRL